MFTWIISINAHLNPLWKIPKEMRISDHIICLLRNLYAGQEATIKAGHGVEKKKLDMEQQTGCQNWERGTSRLHMVTLLI